MSDPYKQSFEALRTNAQSLLGQCMAIDSISRWRGELVKRCHELLKAIDWVEADDASRRVDIEKQKRGE